MVDVALGFLLATMIASACWAVIRVRASLKRDSAAIRRRNQLASSEEASTEVMRRLQSLEADQVALSSTLEKLCTSVKRLTSRAGMQDLRSRREESTEATPPVGASKADLLRHYGMAGKVGPAFAAAQQELELKKRTN